MTDEEVPSEYEDEDAESGVFRWMSALVVLLAVAGFFGLAWYAYKNGGEAVDEKDVELVKADTAPVKEAPVNPGGMQIPNQDKTVYGLISGKQEKQPTVERILPAPEEPLSRSDDTQARVSTSAKNKAGDGQQANAAADASAPKEQFNPAHARAANAAGTSQQIPTPQPAVVASNTPPAASPAPTAAAPAKTPQAQQEQKTPSHDDADDADDSDDAKPQTKAETKTKSDAKSAPASNPPSGARVQLGAYKSQDEAESHWSKIAHRFADDVSGKQHYIVRADLGSKGVYYRLQVAPFASAKDAEQFCIDFVSSGQGCILARGK